jgi:hypothetical protein
MTKDESAKSLPSLVLDDESLNSSPFNVTYSENSATVAMLDNDRVPHSSEGMMPHRFALAALKRWIKKHPEPHHFRANFDLSATDIWGREPEAHNSNATSIDSTRQWAVSAFQSLSNMGNLEFLHPALDPLLENHWRHIVELGLDAEFEDGVPGSFDDELDAFLRVDTASRILFAWSALQSTPGNQFLFYRFVERIGYSPSVASHIVPNGLLSSALQSRVPGVRAAAAHALGTIGDAASVQTLQERSFLERNAIVAEIIHRHLQDHVSAAPDPE